MVRCRSAQRAGAGVDGGERVDQHDLPVEPGEVVAEERFDDVGLVALEAARQHGAQRAALVGGAARRRQREEGEQRRSRQIARQQEAARSRRGQLGVGRARGLQVAREERGAGRAPICSSAGCVGIERGEELRASPWRPRPRCGARASSTARRDQSANDSSSSGRSISHSPGIVDDVDVQAPGPQRAAQRRGVRVLDGDAQLADALGALRPLRRVARQLGQVLLVGEARARRRRAAARDRRGRRGPRPWRRRTAGARRRPGCAPAR